MTIYDFVDTRCLADGATSAKRLVTQRVAVGNDGAVVGEGRLRACRLPLPESLTMTSRQPAFVRRPSGILK